MLCNIFTTLLVLTVALMCNADQAQNGTNIAPDPNRIILSVDDTSTDHSTASSEDASTLTPEYPTSGLPVGAYRGRQDRLSSRVKNKDQRQRQQLVQRRNKNQRRQLQKRGTRGRSGQRKQKNQRRRRTRARRGRRGRNNRRSG